MENWKDIKGYEGIYQVSDLGNVKSLPRMVPSPRGLSRFIKERILKTGSNNGGYLSVILCKDGIMKTKSIHQLVAESFLNHIPFGRELVVNHINFTREDNKLENLEIISFRQNTNKKHLKSSSKYTGVFWMKNKNKWISSIRINNKNKYLGIFINEYDAHLAYEKALQELLNQSKIKP